MVRYSKLPLRNLVRSYACDVTYTPMILAHEFIRSNYARDSDFSTIDLEVSESHALIVQFASSDPVEFGRAAELIAPWVDGVDLNCGCPQSWAIKEGIGCSLMEQPEKVAETLREARRRMGKGKSVSCKIRLHKDLQQTIAFINTLLASTDGRPDFITIHSRTRSQRSSTAPDHDSLGALIKHFPQIPIVANGSPSPNGTLTISDVRAVHKQTGCAGVMAARATLLNPALFAGFDTTPVECIQRFLREAVSCPIPFSLVLHHVGEMSAHMARGEGISKEARKQLMDCRDLVDLIDFVEERWGLGE
ncbi:hypothetical protein MBLNU230_g3414t2 [Neophaeotheca triangularis]